MVAQHYRWDFIGLSTDQKPTPATSEKVVDGSTFYCSDNSKLYVYCKNQWYEKTATGGGGSYTAGEGIDITSNTISVDTDTIQEKLTAGTNITIADNVISAAGGDSVFNDNKTAVVASKSQYSSNAGTGSTSLTYQGLAWGSYSTAVGDNADARGDYSICIGAHPTTTSGSANATRAIAVGTNNKTNATDSVNIGTEGIISGGSDSILIGKSGKIENATKGIAIGVNAQSIGYNGTYPAEGGIALGNASKAYKYYSMAIGPQATCGAYGANNNGIYSVALGAHSATTESGVVSVGNPDESVLYNNTGYRKITNVYDGQELHDAATVAQGNTLSTSAPTTSTVGVLGQLYTDTTNMHTYQCTAISGSTYTWTQRW